MPPAANDSANASTGGAACERNALPSAAETPAITTKLPHIAITRFAEKPARVMPLALDIASGKFDRNTAHKNERLGVLEPTRVAPITIDSGTPSTSAPMKIASGAP